MRILLMSVGGIGAWFLLRLQEEGHKCDWFLIDEEPRQNQVLHGLIPPPLKSIPKFSDYDLVIFDVTGNPELAEKAGRTTPVLGDSELASKLEDDRLFGIEMMEQCGIEVPPYENFKTPEEAKAFLAENPKRYVYKPFTIM
jgi:glutathione synthase/RimK-type ligase-like ATP-grasp enzyme